MKFDIHKKTFQSQVSRTDYSPCGCFSITNIKAKSRKILHYIVLLHILMKIPRVHEDFLATFLKIF